MGRTVLRRAVCKSMKLKACNKDEYYYHSKILRSLSLQALTNALENTLKQSSDEEKLNNSSSYNGIVNEKNEIQPSSFLLDNFSSYLQNQNKNNYFLSSLLDKITNNDTC